MIHIPVSKAVALLSPLVTLSLALPLHKKAGRSDRFFLYLLGLGTATIFVHLLKVWIDYPRPEAALVTETDPSFPSNHASLGFFPLGFYWQAVGLQEKLLLALYGILVAYSRLVLRVHFLRDVAVGGAIGFFLAYLTVRFGGEIISLLERTGLRG